MKFALIIITILTMSACGFTPVYSTQSISQSMSDIDIGIIPNREGQIVRNHLIDRLYLNGRPDAYRYALNIAPIRERIVEIGIDLDDEASRAQLRLETTMTLRDLDTNTIVLTRAVRTTTGYNILAGQFTTYITEEDARKQALKAISDNIITQLELFFN